MTRINTNVPSLVAQNRLQRSNNSLQTALTRLSTGLRINTGSDDPAGLIASEALRSEITSLNKAISNTKRANQIIATADSSLSQVSSLLNDVRGLVVEAANNGALSPDEIAANQLQIDSSLEAINRIAQTTTFQGRKLLDGSLDFTTAAGTNFNKISDLQIEQASLGTTGSVTVDVNVSAAATKAQVDVTGIPAATSAGNASANFSLSKTITQASGGVLTYGTGTLSLAAFAGGTADGSEGNALSAITINFGQASAGSSYNAASNTLTVNVTTADGSTDINDLVGAINTTAGRSFVATAGANAGTDQAASTAANVTTSLTGGRDAGSATIKVLADTSGTAANGVTVTLIEDSALASGTAQASIVSGNIQLRLNGTVSYSTIASQINGLAGYSATVLSSSGDQDYVTTLDTPPAAATLTGGATAAGGISQDAVFSLAGKNGSEVFNVKAGTSIAQLADAINLVKDATGVEATVNSTTLELRSTSYGLAALVNVEVLSEASGGSITTGLGAVSKKSDSGSDIVATVNGISAKGEGNSLSINTATLDFKATIEAAFTGTSSFTINGGGALFQLGPDVVGNQQARLGIGALSTGRLGGSEGRLYELGSGEAKSLANDAAGAARVIDQVIDKVTGLRGRLGAFQRTTLDSNLASLTDTVANLQEAQSSIRDADFAQESANLTRAQILVQSGTQVLQLANQNPQSVLALLRG
jgi:flagellin